MVFKDNAMAEATQQAIANEQIEVVAELLGAVRSAGFSPLAWCCPEIVPTAEARTTNEFPESRNSI